MNLRKAFAAALIVTAASNAMAAGAAQPPEKKTDAEQSAETMLVQAGMTDVHVKEESKFLFMCGAEGYDHAVIFKATTHVENPLSHKSIDTDVGGLVCSDSSGHNPTKATSSSDLVKQPQKPAAAKVKTP